jgi:hypothetical protein
MYIIEKLQLLRSYGTFFWQLWGDADKSLVRPGRKLGTYSTYSPQSSIRFLACCSNFCKPLKKIQKFVCPTRFPRQQWPPIRKKNGDFQLFFQSREQVVVRRGLTWRIGWVIKTLEAQVGQFLLGCKWPVSLGIVVLTLWWPSCSVFP